MGSPLILIKRILLFLLLCVSTRSDLPFLSNIQAKAELYRKESLYSFPNWKKPIFKFRDTVSKKLNPSMSQQNLRFGIYNETKDKNILNLVEKETESKGLKCGINGLYTELNLNDGDDDLKISDNKNIIYAQLHSENKVLVYINKKIHIRIFDHIICWKMKFTEVDGGGCYQSFVYHNFDPEKIKGKQFISTQILVVNNNEVLTNYYLLIYIDNTMRVISKSFFFFQ